MSETLTKFEAVIGLEIHAEMLTQSKMFSGCRVVDSVEAAPNSAVDPLSLGMPGMLPVINRSAVEMAMKVGLALNCEINAYNAFERKNYFYPDLPKGYQITQYAHPVATNGYLDIKGASGETKRVRIRRAHIEEDTGKLTHLSDGRSLVDYNRAGVPLLEIVSEPDMRTAEEALAFATKIRQILRYLDVNTGDMEKGIIRFEANISIRPLGSDALNTRVEVKNLNSFRSLTSSIEYQIAQQIETVEGGSVVEQATLGWDEDRKQTYSQRSKEDAHDYRYFPEPDLPPLIIGPDWIDRVREQLVELPDSKLRRYLTELGLPSYDAEVIVEDRPVAEWFDAAVAAGGDPKTVANWLINNLFALMNEHKQTIENSRVSPQGMVDLLALIEAETINKNTAKSVLVDMFLSGQTAKTIVEEKGLAQISDDGPILTIIQTIIDDNPQMVANYLGGKDKLRGWFMGQVMRELRGKGNPALVNRLLDQKLGELKKR
ncbi:MAG: Asp-tRNA(Asn)/Glu-tRNA(Gln) amidotransferase subunit GatB [Ardenticatenaceae bacterium]|nr:Asp-tRNA(Asn)/Glu-tRNA(Gln) amidotransferase subunit GatB [Ardenticatenaceae bacterium]